MLSVKDKGILLQVVTYCERINSKIVNCSKEHFDNDLDVREIVCFNLFQIGELVKGLSDEFMETYNKLPWKLIKGMRDRIGHGYGTIDVDIVYETAVSSIDELNLYCKDILRKNN